LNNREDMVTSAQHPPSRKPLLVPRLRPARSKIVSGSLTLLAGSGVVGLSNLIYNLAVAHLLGPDGFANASAVYTLLMLTSAITLAFQIVCAKLVANHQTPSEKASVYFSLHRKAWRIGLTLGTVLFICRGLLSSYLALPDNVLIDLLAVGTAFYIPLGARRGFIQGQCDFTQLAGNFILEGLVRLGGAYLLIKLGLGVNGAVLASIAAVILAYVFARVGPQLREARNLHVPVSFGEGLQAITFFVGQVIINNFDIVLVKHFFPSTAAGLYAAVALVGRVLNMCTWSIVNSMFPLSAGTQAEEREGKPLLLTSLLLVFFTLVVAILGVWMTPSFVWKVVFGAQFELTGYGTISSLVTLYALSTGVYSLGAVVIAYEMSRRIANTSWVQLAFSAALVLGISLFHSSLYEVVLVQLVLMSVLLVLVLLPFLRFNMTAPELRSTDGGYLAVHKRGLLSEEEVIAEFLKNEFHHPEFNQYREKFDATVSHPNFNSPEQNSVRRALLFLRRGAMWRELPADTQWYEVELTAKDLDRVRVFPRAHWRQIARGSFYVTDIVNRIREQSQTKGEDEFFSKIRLLGRLLSRDLTKPTVLLIGLDEQGPLTILDGNHRIAAAMLASPGSVTDRFRFICGFSPSMTKCCWYQTNMGTLWRYAKNLVMHIAHDPTAEIGHYLESNPYPPA
jgi:O-antigen/teichoic acid export membrane protein